MASLIIISWRDIPAQVIVKRARETAKVQLSARFQEAVDRAAMRAGRGASDAYLADWKRADSCTLAVSRARLTITCAGMSRQEMMIRLATPGSPGSPRDPRVACPAPRNR